MSVWARQELSDWDPYGGAQQQVVKIADLYGRATVIHYDDAELNLDDECVEFYSGDAFICQLPLTQFGSGQTIKHGWRPLGDA